MVPADTVLKVIKSKDNTYTIDNDRTLYLLPMSWGQGDTPTS